MTDQTIHAGLTRDRFAPWTVRRIGQEADQ